MLPTLPTPRGCQVPCQPALSLSSPCDLVPPRGHPTHNLGMCLHSDNSQIFITSPTSFPNSGLTRPAACLICPLEHLISFSKSAHSRVVPSPGLLQPDSCRFPFFRRPLLSIFMKPSLIAFPYSKSANGSANVFRSKSTSYKTQGSHDLLPPSSDEAPAQELKVMAPQPVSQFQISVSPPTNRMPLGKAFYLCILQAHHL